MKKKTLFMLAGAAAIGAYSAIEGKGPFNKIKFKDQHDAVSRYIETHYNGALYSPISKTQNGWVTIIRRFNQPNIVLYITKDDMGNYIFTENTAEFNNA